ncbi:MAG: hypothetical protein KatS3mg104_1291 [Phycisphaerae bacterium]|jgi:hypothetical protein|nr:MAG: hypothetical protein KatS3mg104_1291 [Phycisphaerae bacterium]
MIRIRYIQDPELKSRIIAKLAEWRGLLPSQIPEWYELDDADYVDLLQALREDDEESLKSDTD